MRKELGHISNKHLARKLAKAAKEGDFDIRQKRIRRKDMSGHFRNLLGEIEGDIITINPNQSDEEKTITFLHELLHLKYPSAPEDTVEQKALDIYSVLSQKQKDFFTFFLDNKPSSQ